jgi:hypothetical protein
MQRHGPYAGVQFVHGMRGARVIHVETELGIVNIYVGLTDHLGRKVESVSMLPNEGAGDPVVRVRGRRFVQLKTKKG